MCIHIPRKILTPRSGVRWHILSTLSKTFIMPILMIIFEASSHWQKECMNKNLLHQQSTVKTRPRLMNCTLCHDWSGVNEASMIRVDSNCSTYIIYTQILDGGYLRSEYYTFCGKKFLLVFTSSDETCSSMVIKVHQNIGDTGYKSRLHSIHI